MTYGVYGLKKLVGNSYDSVNGLKKDWFWSVTYLDFVKKLPVKSILKIYPWGLVCTEIACKTGFN